MILRDFHESRRRIWMALEHRKPHIQTELRLLTAFVAFPCILISDNPQELILLVSKFDQGISHRHHGFVLDRPNFAKCVLL
jgi:hypothetical protein